MSAVVVFDLDDTLYLERDFVRSGFEAVDRWLVRERAVSGFLEQAWQLFSAGRRGDIFDRALPGIGVDPEPPLIQRLITVYRAHRPHIWMHPEALDLLDRLRGRCPLAVLTDGYHDTQRRKVAALALEARCHPIVCTDRWGQEHWKPSPKGFLHIQEVLGVAPQRCTYIGDNPAKDFRAPRALGWRTLRLRHPEGEHARATPASPLDDADATLASLAEIDEADLLADRS